MASVARALGVHQTTVSLALRGHPSIPPATRERIRLRAELMGYRPNPLVSALMAERRKGRASGKGAQLALLTTGSGRESWRKTSPNYARLYRAIVARAESLGYAADEYWLDDPSIRPDRHRRILLQRGVRGLIVCPLPQGRMEIDFDFSDFAAAALRYSLRSPALDHVSVDYTASMHLALARLLEDGFRRIAFVTTVGIDSRVHSLSLGAFLAGRFQQSRRLLPPRVQAHWDGRFIRKWVREAHPDAVILPTVGLLKDFQAALSHKQPELVVLDCHLNSNERGILQDVSQEGRAVVDLVTSRLERGEFGLPASPQTILVSGSWRDAIVEDSASRQS